MKIFLLGFMGSGKTYWGQQLAQKMNLPFFDLDAVVALTGGKTVTEIFSEQGEEYFRYQEKAALEKLIEENDAFVISTGGGTPCFFNNLDLMKDSGTTIWLNTPVAVLLQRLSKEKQHRPLLKNIDDDDLRQTIIKKLGTRKIYYEQAHIILHSEELTLDTFAENLKNA
jgi:shikimate kinase